MVAEAEPVGAASNRKVLWKGGGSPRTESVLAESEAGSEEEKWANQSTGSEKSFNTKLKEAEEKEQSLKKHHVQ